MIAAAAIFMAEVSSNWSDPLIDGMDPSIANTLKFPLYPFDAGLNISLASSLPLSLTKNLAILVNVSISALRSLFFPLLPKVSVSLV